MGPLLHWSILTLDQLLPRHWTIGASTLDHLDIGPWVHLDIRPDIGQIFDIGPITASTLEHLDIGPIGLYIGPPQTSICQPHSCKKTYQSSTCDIYQQGCGFEENI